MRLERRAVIDVGTNSTKMLVADVAGHEVRPVWEGSKQTRLGQGLYETHRLQPEPLARTTQAVAAFVAQAQEHQATSIRVIATSAARDATNSQELVDLIKHATGLTLEIISGEQEADWAFQGVTTNLALAQEPLLLMEVGGGSLQLILGQGEHKHFLQSYQVGTVRLLQQIPHSDPPQAEELEACRQWLREFLRREVRPRLEPAMDQELRRQNSQSSIRLVGTGGTATILARMEAELDSYDRDRLEAARLSPERLDWHVNHLWSLPLNRRQQIVGLPPNRADVILTGAVIYAAMMREFNFPELRISTRGLRFAAVMQR
ncbi:MAG TPA: hypothetical protein VN673_16665 [Clostridia bacterium]|nr:hypothetical protein [Clostridia bacterium]